MDGFTLSHRVLTAHSYYFRFSFFFPSPSAWFLMQSSVCAESGRNVRYHWIRQECEMLLDHACCPYDIQTQSLFVITVVRVMGVGGRCSLSRDRTHTHQNCRSLHCLLMFSVVCSMTYRPTDMDAYVYMLNTALSPPPLSSLSLCCSTLA